MHTSFLQFSAKPLYVVKKVISSRKRMAQISAGTLIFLQAKSKVGKGDIWSFGRQMRVFHCSKLFGQKIFFFKTLFIFASKNSDKRLKV